ncbi:MAG: sodium:proton antiporter [Pantoea sp.]|uniref:cation:proton antiporter n=1 Tax=Pantoea sp. TaxID=69393 RepID=UPI0039E43C58
MELSVPLLLVIIGFTSLVAQWIAWLIRLPAILTLLLCGILLGPVTQILKPDALFGNLLFPLVSLAVAIILFEGALTLRFSDVKGLGRVIRNLVTVGMLATFVVVSLACWGILQLTPEISALIGAVTVVTGPTVIAPLMRVVRPNAAINQILRWEGIVIDPVGAIFTLLVFEFITLRQETNTWFHLLATLIKTLSVGVLLGGIAGWLLGNALKRAWIPVYLQNFAVLAVILASFGLSNAIADEAGLMTVTVAGVWLANMRDVDISDILAFKEELSAILISALFIILAARLDLHSLMQMGWPLLGMLLIVQLVARPLCIVLATLGSQLKVREKLLLSWIAPRGIVAAAVSSLFALTLERNGYPGANQLVTVVFAVIIGTVVIQSLTSSPLARLLKVQQRKPRGVMITSADEVARSFGIALKKIGIPVQLADNNWEYCRLARMEGLPAYYGNPWSEHAENSLDISSIAQVFALSPDQHRNALSVYHFSHLLGSEHVFTVRSDAGDKASSTTRKSRFGRQTRLLGAGITWEKLNQLLSTGGYLKATNLNENFGWTDYLEKNHGVVPLFALNEAGFLIALSGEAMPPLPFTLVALVRE